MAGVVVLLLVAIPVMTAGTVYFAQPAIAWQGHTFNMAGWKQVGSGLPADYVIFRAQIGQYYGSGLPLGIVTQETCSVQRNRILNGLYALGGSTGYESKLYSQRDYYNQSTCIQFGPAAFGLANTPGAPWLPSDAVPYASAIQQPGASRSCPNPFNCPPPLRGYVCVYPTEWIVQYAVCSTHLDTANAKAELQADVYRANTVDRFDFFAVPANVGGDFNLGPGNAHVSPIIFHSNVVYANWLAGTTCCYPGYASTIDFFLFERAWTFQSIAQNEPLCVSGWACGSFGGRYSDHKYVQAGFG